MIKLRFVFLIVFVFVILIPIQQYLNLSEQRDLFVEASQIRSQSSGRRESLKRFSTATIAPRSWRLGSVWQRPFPACRSPFCASASTSGAALSSWPWCSGCGATAIFGVRQPRPFSPISPACSKPYCERQRKPPRA